MVLLDENAIKSMAPGRFFRDHKGAVNSLDFHHTEDVMVTVGTFDRPAKNPGVLPAPKAPHARGSLRRARSRGEARGSLQRPSARTTRAARASPPSPRNPEARSSLTPPSRPRGSRFFVRRPPLAKPFSSGDDDALHLYRTNTGTLLKTLYSKKYGCSCVTFTHASQAVVYASKVKAASKDPRKDHALRYHSLHDNTYLRYFVGHTKQVVSVSMSAKTDQFLSAAADHTIRLWYLITNQCNGVVRCATTPAVAYDMQGLIFAAATDDGEVKLYDARGYDKGPFNTIAIGGAKGAVDPATGKRPRVTTAKFSDDGNDLMCVAGGMVYIHSAFTPFEEVMRIDVAKETGGSGGKHAGGLEALDLEACWTPDGQYVLSGGADSRVHVWSVRSGSKVTTWQSRHAGVPSSVRWAPGSMMAASACTEGGCALWIPQID